MSSTIINLPDWAESSFAALCDAAGVTRNKATQDRAGWDYLLEIEQPVDPRLSHDEQSGGVSARVQVKSKRGGKPRVTLKLSNALRFARDPMPCFVVLFWQSKDGAARRVFARHFDPALIEQALRRAREADRDREETLNRIEISFGLDDSDDHTADPIGWLRSEVLAAGDQYAADKAKLNKTVGYGDPAITGTFSLPQAQVQSLIEHGVGLGPAVEIDHASVSKLRFSIPDRTPIFSGKPAQFNISVNPRPAVLAFSRPGEASIEFPGELRSMNFPGLPSSYGRTHFTSPYMQMVVQGEDHATISFDFKPDERRPLSVLETCLRLHVAARQGQVEAELRVGDMTFEALPMDIPTDHSDWAARMLPSIVCFRNLAKPAGNPEMSFVELSQHQDEAIWFTMMLSDDPAHVEVHVADDFEYREVKGLFGYLHLGIGDSTFAAIIERPLVAHTRGDKLLKLSFGPAQLIEGHVFPARAKKIAERLSTRLAKVVQRTGVGAASFGDGDLMASRNQRGDFMVEV